MSSLEKRRVKQTYFDEFFKVVNPSKIVFVSYAYKPKVYEPQVLLIFPRVLVLLFFFFLFTSTVD